MSFECFKGFPPDSDSAIVEIQVRNENGVEIPAEVRRDGDRLRIAIFANKAGAPWDYPVDDWLDAINRAIELLSDE